MEKDQLGEWVFDTINGFLEPECCLDNVENLFEEGKRCSQLYRDMAASRERLASRLECSEEDSDIEGLIAPLLDITRIVGMKMFQYGYQLGMQKETL